MTALIIAEHDKHSLKPAALACGAVQFLRLAYKACAARGATTGPTSVAQARLADTPYLHDDPAEEVAASLCANAADSAHIPAPTSTGRKNILSRTRARFGVAANRDVGQLSELARVLFGEVFERLPHVGKVLTTSPVKLSALRATGFDAASEGSIPIESVPAIANRTRLRTRSVAACDVPGDLLLVVPQLVPTLAEDA